MIFNNDIPITPFISVEAETPQAPVSVQANEKPPRGRTLDVTAIWGAVVEHRREAERLVEWKLRGHNLGFWNAEHEAFFQDVRTKELDFWKSFMVPTEKYSAVLLAKLFRDAWRTNVGVPHTLEVTRLAMAELGFTLEPK
jgi:hypothetical protein